MRAVGDKCGNLEVVSSLVSNMQRRSRHVDVSMFVYIEIASYAKMHAFGGRDIVSRMDLRSKEFLKYVGCVCMMG